ncbi:MAG: hypothetical protein WBV55_19985 [Candidatus Sulfotelmatobacter sp.]
MRLLGRIVLTVVITLTLIFVSVQWIAPVALSFYTVRKARPVVRIIPIDLKDKSVSDAPGKQLSYFGYEFEVPWSDLDETQTKLYPINSSEKNGVDLRFRSGLRLEMKAVPPREWAMGLSETFTGTPQATEALFGHETMKSDYSFLKTLYEFTPDKMNHWAPSQGAHVREEFLLTIKSISLSKAAESGIFNLQNQSYRGFQQGNPEVRQDGIAVNLYSGEGSVEIIFLQKYYQNSAGVTQPEINRIVQSLRRVPQGGGAATQLAGR